MRSFEKSQLISSLDTCAITIVSRLHACNHARGCETCVLSALSANGFRNAKLDLQAAKQSTLSQLYIYCLRTET